MNKKWSATDIEKHYQEKGLMMPDEVSSAIKDLGISRFISQDSQSKKMKPLSFSDLREDTKETIKKLGPPNKKLGVKIEPIVASLKTSLIHVALFDDPSGNVNKLVFWFDGARILSVNELFSILQTRDRKMFRYKVSSYKKESRKLIERAVLMLPRKNGVKFKGFPERVKITLFRRGTKLVDLDSLPVMFKYLIDSLKKQEIIIEDNPEVVVEYALMQETGDFPAIAMLVERVDDWNKKELSSLKEQWLSSGVFK